MSKLDMYVPQARQNTENCVVQKKDTVPKYVDIPQMTGIQVPFYPESFNETSCQTARY